MALLTGAIASGCAPVQTLPTEVEQVLEEYRSEAKYTDFKAMAYDSETESWGRAWGHRTPEDAIVAAVEKCERNGRGCALYALGNKKVWGISGEDLYSTISAYYKSFPGRSQIISCMNFEIQTKEYIEQPVTGDCVLSKSGQNALLVRRYSRFFHGFTDDTKWYMNVTLRSAVSDKRFHYIPVRELTERWRVVKTYGMNFGAPSEQVIDGVEFETIKFDHQEHVNRHYCIGFSAFFEGLRDGGNYRKHLYGYICSAAFKRPEEFYFARIGNLTLSEKD